MWILMRDGTRIEGTVDAVAAGQVWFGWVAVPLIRTQEVLTIKGAA